MVVADDLRPHGAAPARLPSKRLVPAPHTMPGGGGGGYEPLAGRRNNAVNSTLLPAALAQQMLAQQASSTALSTQLGSVQRTVKEQAIELKEVKQELS